MAAILTTGSALGRGLGAGSYCPGPRAGPAGAPFSSYALPQQAELGPSDGRETASKSAGPKHLGSHLKKG